MKASQFIQYALLCILISSPLYASTFENGWIVSHQLVFGAMLLSSVYHQNTFFLYSLDIILVLVGSYLITHHLVLSDYSIYHMYIWIYVSYICLVLYFNHIFRKSGNKKQLQLIFLISLIAVACIEALITIGQYSSILPSNHRLFKGTGTFLSPNLTAFYFALASVMCCWLWLTYASYSKVAKYILPIITFSFLVLILMSGARSTWIAVFFGVILLAVPRLKPSRRHYTITKGKVAILLISGCTALLGTSYFLYHFKPESAKSRLLIYTLTIEEIIKNPFLGYGSFSFPGKYNEAKAAFFASQEQPWEIKKIGSYAYTTYNDFLNVTFEFGSIGLVLILLPLGYVLYKSPLNTRTSLPWAIIVMTALFALFSYPIKIPQLMLPFLFCVAILAHDLQRKPAYRITLSPLANRFIRLGFGSVFLFLPIVEIVAQINRNNFHEQQKEKKLTRKKLDAYFDLPIDDNEHIFQWGKALCESGYTEDGIRYMEKAFSKTFLPQYGEWLAAYQEKVGNWKRAQELYRIHINNEPYRFHSRVEYAKLLFKGHQYEENRKVLQEIVDLPIKIPSVKVQEYKNFARLGLTFLDSIKANMNTYQFSIPRSIPYTKDRDLTYACHLPEIGNIKGKLPVLYLLCTDEIKEQVREAVLAITTSKTFDPMVFIVISDILIDRSNEASSTFTEPCHLEKVQLIADKLMGLFTSNYPISNDKTDRSILGFGTNAPLPLIINARYPNVFGKIGMAYPVFQSCKESLRQTKDQKDTPVYWSYYNKDDMIYHKKLKNYFEGVGFSIHQQSLATDSVPGIITNYVKDYLLWSTSL